jgi:hypothetical protein
MLKKLLSAAALSLTLVGTALAQVYPAPQVTVVNPNDLFQDIPNGIASAGSQYASASLLGGYFGSWGAESSVNFLIGGDATTNLWQRGTSGTAGTGATVLYPSADRWFAWQALAGSTGFTLTQVNSGAALPTGTGDAIEMKLSNSVTGTAQICMGQEITGINSIYLAGHTVELDFNAYAAAKWTASQINAYIIYGTHAFPADEGSADMAFGLNANSASSSTWTGQTVATSGAFPMAISTLYRGVAVATLPSTATEIGVALCWTPNGTSSGSGGTDGVAFSNIELRRAGYLSALANSTTAYAISANNTIQAVVNGVTQNYLIPPFAWRPAEVEAALQYAYYYQINEGGTAGTTSGLTGYYAAATTCFANLILPTAMRAAPTIQNSAITTSTFAVSSAGTTNEAAAALAGSGNSGLVIPTGGTSQTPHTVVTLSFITASKVQYNACTVVSAAGGGNFGVTAEE